MIGHIKTAFSSLVQESHWMDQETKIRALEKAAAMKDFVAYPDWILNKTRLSQIYEGVCSFEISIKFGHINKLDFLIQFRWRRLASTLRMPLMSRDF